MLTMDSSEDPPSSTQGGSTRLDHSRDISGHTGLSGLYHLGRTLGRGHFAVVKLGRHAVTGQLVAVKMIDKTKLDVMSASHLLQEVRCMKLVQHPNVVCLYEVFDTPTTLYLVMELAEGGDLYDYILRHEGGVAERTAKRHFAQIVRAVAYCHRLHVVHRDLKPENVVFFPQQGAVKLTDFGFSNLFQPGTMLATSCGSLAYSAPEILLGEEYDAPAVDIWSLGVILYMLVCGVPPFQEANDSETLVMILDCRYSIPEHISDHCRSLISRMLQRDPSLRASLEEIEAHEWLEGLDDVLLSPEAPPHWLSGAAALPGLTRPGVPESGDLLAARPQTQLPVPAPWQPRLSPQPPPQEASMTVPRVHEALQQICEEEEEEEEEEVEEQQKEEEEEEQKEEQEEKEEEEETEEEEEEEERGLLNAEWVGHSSVPDENAGGALEDSDTPERGGETEPLQTASSAETEEVHVEEDQREARGEEEEGDGEKGTGGTGHVVSNQPVGETPVNPTPGGVKPLSLSAFMGVRCCQVQPDPADPEIEPNNNTHKSPPLTQSHSLPVSTSPPRPSVRLGLRGGSEGEGGPKADGEREDLLADRPRAHNNNNASGCRAEAEPEAAPQRSEPGKGRGLKLRQRLFQFPLCEKALAFNMPPHKNKILPLGQYNCCHVL